MKRGHADLINYQTFEFCGYQWIMHYQDHTNKFIILAPLFNKTGNEVAKALILSVFTYIGDPDILQSDNGGEFVAEIVKSLRFIWLDMKIFHGRPRHPQSQGSTEPANADVETMLSLWMKDNISKNWSTQICANAKNNSHYSTIKCTPYFATFGREMSFGLVNGHVKFFLYENLFLYEFLICKII